MNLADNLSRYRTALEQLKGRRSQIQLQIREARAQVAAAEARVINTETAQTVIQTVAQATQKELEYQVSELATLALSSVFPDPYRLRLVFELRRGRSEADLLFERGGNPCDPMTASGGGPVDVAAFALRVSLWSLRRPRTRALIVLDEPFRFLSRNLQALAGQMLKEVSDRLGLQILMVTHIPELVEAADRVFAVSFRGGESTVSDGPHGVDAHAPPAQLSRAAGEEAPGASGGGLLIEDDPEVAAGGRESKRRKGNRGPSPQGTPSRSRTVSRRGVIPAADTPPAPAAASGHSDSPPTFRRG